MSNLSGVKPGDELLLFVRMGGAREKSQEPRVVKAHKVGRTLVHILQYENMPDGKTHAYSINDGYRNNNYRDTELKTREGWEAEKLEASLRERLREHGFTYQGSRHSTETLSKVLGLLDATPEEN
ncbi:hypothetical protein [Streptomyces sp. NPDC088752]|uniref:beta barrel domain-containing protein n=1 Tax=Streptomyces sp. NPDC088752 TaxID=3154963 RepID=UPI003414E975